MGNLFGLVLLLLLDVSPDPVQVVPWGSLILLLVIVFVLAVSFAAGLVFLLIWLKRRKATSPWQSKPPPRIHHFTNTKGSKVGNDDGDEIAPH